MRGEYAIAAGALFAITGSPPLAWGIRLAILPAVILVRITPTCVGNTMLFLFAVFVGRDHPHLRGEYVSLTTCKSCNTGSPPLAWGIPTSGQNNIFICWITPTCVGNTKLIALASFQGRDHPHLRGEYIAFEKPGSSWLGSPPLAWGIPTAQLMPSP